MDFGVVLQTDPPASRVVELTKMAENLGFTHAWAFDSHVLWQEPFVIFAAMLAATDRIVVGPMVTNPATRDWTVLASLFATLDDMYDGRTICGIGRGDSAVRYIGKKPRTLAATSEAIDVIRGLVAGEEVDYQGTHIKFPWVEEGWDLPMWVAGYGPKALDMIGRRGDGYILQLADHQILDWTSKAVHDSARAAGRKPEDVAICVAAPAYVGTDIAHQREELRWFGGMVGNHVVDLVHRYGAGGGIPQALTDYIKSREGYDYSHHGRSGNPSTEFVPDEIIDRFCVLGTVDDHIRRMRELKSLGVTQFAIYLMHDDPEGTLEAYGNEIIPAVNG